ncbi:tunicamycin resistance protein, variant 3 [Basidiobolus ranarum]|uniref:UDP-N-acetylglucosamine--dolichyl-phosphate N-acetylglucosaminephosphotransferase n=2 Tax=Basidiobolus ranarum TaxID=34480 RepID=A0ABR2W3Y0_9FUNG
MPTLRTLFVLAGIGLVSCTSSDPLHASLGLSVLAGLVTWELIPRLSPTFLKAGLSGKDMCKKAKPILPESMGVVCAMVYLITLIIFIPFPFVDWFPGVLSERGKLSLHTFPYHKLGLFLSGILTIQSMVMLGFGDDVLDIRWRYKLILPTIASIPLLVIYYVSGGVTTVMVPLPFRGIFGPLFDLGILYYLYMAMLAVFCTNSINILAGVNGVEVGQSIIIATSVVINDSLYLDGTNIPALETHLFSLYFLLPFIGVSVALFVHNWYPARVFVGDTYCYFAGMTLAVVSIMGHFTKTILLFFIPQIFNFIYSAPQLFHFVDCPRHRMPKLNRHLGKLEATFTELSKISPLGKIFLRLYEALGLIQVERNEDGVPIRVNNFTLLNLLLCKLGPLRERQLVIYVMCIQILASFVSFFIRYKMASLIYEVVD